MDNNTVWNSIPLEDYEAHMANAQVGQLQLLNSLTKKYLQQLRPASCIFLGIAGGNGLEHIDNTATRQVITVDINPQYLAKTHERYVVAIPALQTVELDIVQHAGCVTKSKMIWAALIFEYTGVDAGLAFCANNIARKGNLAVTIQLNNGVTSVSNTGVESVKQAGSVFKAVDPAALIEKATDAGFVLVEEEENFLPNGKSFKTYLFKYQ